MKCVINSFSAHEHRAAVAASHGKSARESGAHSFKRGTVLLCCLHTYCTVFRFHKVERHLAGVIYRVNKAIIWWGFFFSFFFVFYRIPLFPAHCHHIREVTGSAPCSSKPCPEVNWNPVTFVSSGSGSGQRIAADQSSRFRTVGGPLKRLWLSQEVPCHYQQFSLISEGYSTWTLSPVPQSMSSFVESSEVSDSKLLPCSCSASWKLHSIAIKVM